MFVLCYRIIAFAVWSVIIHRIYPIFFNIFYVECKYLFSRCNICQQSTENTMQYTFKDMIKLYTFPIVDDLVLIQLMRCSIFDIGEPQIPTVQTIDYTQNLVQYNELV